MQAEKFRTLAMGFVEKWIKMAKTGHLGEDMDMSLCSSVKEEDLVGLAAS